MAKYTYGFNLDDEKHRAEIEKAVVKLPQDVQVVLAARFGLLGQNREGLTVRQIVRRFKLPQLKVQEALETGLNQLHQVFQARPTTRVGRARKSLGLEDPQPTTNRSMATLGDILGLTAAASNC
jgi:hypothetical protein